MVVTEPGIVIDFNAEQQENAQSSIVVTEFGILTDCRLEHQSNACFPMVLTEFGMSMETNAEQWQYLQPIITQYFIDNKSEIWLLFLIAHSKR